MNEKVVNLTKSAKNNYKVRNICGKFVKYAKKAKPLIFEK